MSGRTETIRLTDGREYQLPPFVFGELREWLEASHALEQATTRTPQEVWTDLQRQLAVVHRALARRTPELTLADFENHVVYQDLDATVWDPVRRVNGLVPVDPPMPGRAAAA